MRRTLAILMVFAVSGCSRSTQPSPDITYVVGRTYSGTVQGTLEGVPYSSPVWIKFSSYDPGGMCDICAENLRGSWQADPAHAGMAEGYPVYSTGVTLYLHFPTPCGTYDIAYWSGDATFDRTFHHLTGTLHSYTGCNKTADLNLDVSG